MTPGIRSKRNGKIPCPVGTQGKKVFAEETYSKRKKRRHSGIGNKTMNPLRAERM